MKTKQLMEDDNSPVWFLAFGFRVSVDEMSDVNDIAHNIASDFNGEEVGSGYGFGIREIDISFDAEKDALAAKQWLRRYALAQKRAGGMELAYLGVTKFNPETEEYEEVK